MKKLVLILTVAAVFTSCGGHKTQKSFSDDMVKCNVNEKKVQGERLYYGIVRKI